MRSLLFKLSPAWMTTVGQEAHGQWHLLKGLDMVTIKPSPQPISRRYPNGSVYRAARGRYARSLRTRVSEVVPLRWRDVDLDRHVPKSAACAFTSCHKRASRTTDRQKSRSALSPVIAPSTSPGSSPRKHVPVMSRSTFPRWNTGPSSSPG